MWIVIDIEAHMWQRNGAAAFAAKLNELRVYPSTLVIMHNTDDARIISAIGWQTSEEDWNNRTNV